MKRFLRFLVLAFLGIGLAAAQTAVVTRNVDLRTDASTDNKGIAKLEPGAQLQLLEPDAANGYYHVRTADNKTGFVWARSVKIQAASAGGPATAPPSGGAGHAPSSAASGDAPVPLLAKGHPVDWWFVFKFNSKVFPGCGGAATRACLFGGSVQDYPFFSQQFVYASSEARALKQGSDCAGDTTAEPLGATFDQVYNSTFNFVVWNDQFYNDPKIQGCGTSCGGPWGHSKGMLAWNDAGEGLVLQVTTPSWPAAGSKQFPRKTDGNTLGCVKDDNVEVSQHFFSLKLSKDDLVKVLKALQNASVVTDPKNPQLVKNGGPADVQDLVKALGVKSKSTVVTRDKLSSGVELISKPSKLQVPPWQMVSAVLGGTPLRTATWWANPKIYTTLIDSDVACWTNTLGKPGPVEIAISGTWDGKEFGLTGGAGPNFNHAKVGVSTSGSEHYSIFGDMNQQGTTSGQNCASSQNGRGGLFYVVNDADLFDGVKSLISGQSAPTEPPKP
jgi:Deoxyribonuclease II